MIIECKLNMFQKTIPKAVLQTHVCQNLPLLGIDRGHFGCKLDVLCTAILKVWKMLGEYLIYFFVCLGINAATALDNVQ